MSVKRTWIRCRLCRGRLLISIAGIVAALWCDRCDRYRPEDDE